MHTCSRMGSETAMLLTYLFTDMPVPATIFVTAVLFPGVVVLNELRETL